MSELRVGASNTASGVDAYRYVQTVTFTSSGTFVKADYPWLRAIRVKVCGGGGGGAGCTANPGSTSRDVGRGGGGGGYGESFITNIEGLAASETVTVGAGGAGGAAGANSGSNGGTSSFGTFVSASGGTRGIYGGVVADGTSMFLATPSGGGSVITADFAVPGGPAGPDISNSGFGFVVGTPSGGSYLAPGTAGPATTTSIAGANGKSNGGGATGAASRGTSAAAQPGGTGGDGVVIVELYA